MAQFGQDLFVLRFEPPPALEALLVDARVPRRGPAVLLFADSVDLDRLAAEPLEPQRALWTELALGYECEARGAPATAFHYPWLMLSRPHGDAGIALADVEMTRFHAGCPDYDGPAAGRTCEATARTHAGVPLVDAAFTLERAAASLPAGLLSWVNRVAYPDVNSPGALLDAGLVHVRAEGARVADAWCGHGRATFAAGLGWSGEVQGEAWTCGVVYSIDAVTPL